MNIFYSNYFLHTILQPLPQHLFFYLVSLGDDWEIFQVLGRLIAVDNIWVFEQEKETIRRYGIRIYVDLHILFGKSFFPQQMLKFGPLFSLLIFLSKILLNLKVHINISVIFGFILLIVFFLVKILDGSLVEV